MLKNVLKYNKWLRRYKTIFIVTFVFLIFQILISVLLSSKTVVEQDNQWEPSNYESSNNVPNSARKTDEETLKNKKTKHHNLTQIRLEELQFNLPCQINGKEAISAINRAKTQHCKRVIANVTCMGLKNELYPSELKGSCPAKGYIAGKELGCFKDEKNYRLLSGYFGVNKKENSPKYCIQLCLQGGFPIAGVQYSEECFCGIEEPALSYKIPDSSCNMKCPGDQHAMCGGYYTMNVYQTGIKKFASQIANESSEVIKPVKIVFLLTLNGRALRQVKRLIKILYHTHHYYYIHVDVRQDYLFRELLPLEKLPNIKLTRNRFATIWGGASLLSMLRSCMSELLSIDWKWDFVLNLSESDYPVKTLKDLTNFLSANKDRNFVKSHGREVQRFIQKQGLDKTFVECETRMWRVGDRKLPSGIQVDGGSDWIALSRKFVEYVANKNTDDLIEGLLKIFKHTLLPAESFFHTVLRNSKFCNTYIDNNLHVTNWKRKLGCKCQYKHVVDWCGCSPNDFTLEDWPRILNTQSRQLFFARKFEPIINQAIILKLELWLFNLEKPTKDVTNLNSYWQSVYHHNDLGVKTEDSLMMLGESIGRKAVKFLSNHTECQESVKKLLEVTSYHHRDNYKYTLFYFETTDENIEVAVRPLNKITIFKPSPLMENLQKLSVNTEYDQKEQLSRNFLRIISPYSELMLIYKFDTRKMSKQYNLTCLWVDPVGNLQDITEFSIDENMATGHVKSNAKAPHLPGIWNAKILYKNTVLAQISFLIVPQQSNVEDTHKNAQLSVLHGSISQNKDFGEVYSKFLPNISQRETLEKNAIENAKKQGDKYNTWVDSLITKFYSVENVCVRAKTDKNFCGKMVKSCLESNWSSLSPDPKSAITSVNSSTGMFDIW